MSDEVNAGSACSCPECKDLSPDSQREYQQQLEAQIAELQKKRNDVVKQIQQANPNERTLLVRRPYDSFKPTLGDFMESLGKYRAEQKTSFPLISVVEIMFETNYKLKNGGWLKVNECYVRLRTIKEATLLEQIAPFPLTVGMTTQCVRFERPTQDDETRKTFNVIGGLAERLHVVKKELATFDYEISEDRPRLADKYMDKAVFKNQLTAWKNKRSAGHPLHREEFGALSKYVPVDIKSFRKRFEKLWDEQCDLLLDLQAFRCDYPEIQF